MAVYTHITSDDLATLAQRYGFATIDDARPIAEGVENSNYLLTYQPVDTTTPDRAILTIFEARTMINDLPYFMELMRHLSDHGLTCPLPYITRTGDMLVDVAGKKAAIIGFLPGRSVVQLERNHVAQAGTVLAQLHLMSRTFPMHRSNSMAMPSWQILHEKTATGSMNESQQAIWALIADELNFLQNVTHPDLPSGVIHGDLFPNNVFFDARGTLCGVIDFYFACHDAWLYDLAITINAWCFRGGVYQDALAQALLDAYELQRPLTYDERRALPVMLRAAAVRFLVTRLHDVVFHDDDALVVPHDPQDYVTILQHHQAAMHH